MNELNKIVLPNGTELTLPSGGGSDVTAETVREWGFAFRNEVEAVENELSRFDLFDWELLANSDYPTGWRAGYFGRETGISYITATWSRTRRYLYRRNQYCYLQADYPVRVHAFTANPSYGDHADNTGKLVWYMESSDGEPLRFKTDDILYIIVSVRCPLETLTDNPPKLYWVFPNVPTVDAITDSTEDGAIPNAKAVKGYVDAHGGGSEVTEQTVAGWGFTKFNGDYNSLSNKPTIPEPVTDAHINSLIDAKLGVIENGTY